MPTLPLPARRLPRPSDVYVRLRLGWRAARADGGGPEARCTAYEDGGEVTFSVHEPCKFRWGSTEDGAAVHVCIEPSTHNSMAFRASSSMTKEHKCRCGKKS